MPSLADLMTEDRRAKLAREMSHQVTNTPVRIPDIVNTALSRLASGQALATGWLI